MHVVSYYTGEGTYKEFADKLRASCERFAIPCTIERVDSSRDWTRNLHMKSAFVLKHLNRMREPVAWMDCDCEIMEPPEILVRGGSHDFMIYNWLADPERAPTTPTPKAISSGGVFWANTTSLAQQVLYRWATACERQPTLRDDVIFNGVYESWKGPRPRFRWLPRSYNRMDMLWPDVKPVINHVYRNGVIFMGTQRANAPPVWETPELMDELTAARLKGGDSPMVPGGAPGRAGQAHADPPRGPGSGNDRRP